MESKRAGVYAKIGVRVAAKHAVAIVAAYTTYQSKPDFAGQMMAMGMYALSNKAIAASELADLRFWSTLPNSLQMTSVSLKPGEYSLELHTSGPKPGNIIKYKNIIVSKNKSQLVNINIF